MAAGRSVTNRIAEDLSGLGGDLAADEAIIRNGDTVSVKNSAGSKTVAGADIDVAAGALEDINLPATAALVTDSMALADVEPSGSWVDTVTFTVEAGVITAIVLS